MGEGAEPRLDLEPLMNPGSVAIVGASKRRSHGTVVLENLRAAGFAGAIYPINPRYDAIDGLPCFPSVADVPETVDSVVVAIPGPHVPPALHAAREAGARAAVVLSSGFLEPGDEGQRRHEALEDLAAHGMAICGPNCYGVLNLATGAATFSGSLPDPLRRGPLALVSQSGGFTNLVANPLVEDRGLGFKYLVSCGNQAGVRVEDYLDYLLDDPDVEVIGCFVEGLGSPARLIALGERAAARGKWIVMLPSGRSAAAREAVASHTGSVAGSAAVADALLRKAGIVRASSLDELVEVLALLAHGTGSRVGRRVMVVTGSGGEGSHAADAADEAGVVLPELDADTAGRIAAALPDFGRGRNPVDGTGAMFVDDAVFPKLVDAAVHAGDVDVVAVNLGLRPPRPGWAYMQRFAKVLTALDPASRQRVVAYSATSAGPIDVEITGPLSSGGIPVLVGTRTAMTAIARVAQVNETRVGWAAPSPGAATAPGSDAAPGRAPAWPADARELDAETAWSLLAAYGLPVAPMRVVTSAAEALAAAEAIGYPVAVKHASFAVSHKSEAGGVELGVDTPDALHAAYHRVADRMAPRVGREAAARVLVQRMAAGGVELLAGVVRDPALGPAVVVAFGGLLVEILDDSAVALPPVAEDEARRLLASLRGSALLDGVRGGPAADTDAAVSAIVALGRLAADLPDYVRAVDCNPVVVHAQGQGASCVDLWVETS